MVLGPLSGSIVVITVCFAMAVAVTRRFREGNGPLWQGNRCHPERAAEDILGRDRFTEQQRVINGEKDSLSIGQMDQLLPLGGVPSERFLDEHVPAMADCVGGDREVRT